MKLQTPVSVPRSPVSISYDDRIAVLGSCFADAAGERLASCGFDVLVNPFGTLYNPVSVCNAVSRLEYGAPFDAADVVEMGAGAGLYGSFSHHTSFARETPEAFLSHANAALETASARWKACNKVILTLGTSMVWRHLESGEIVANCLKRPGGEFQRETLSERQCADLLSRLVRRHGDKQFILTVSPIRHTGDGAHANTLSKARLLLSVDAVVTAFPERCAYFPAYEILLDELRDYRFYAEDMIHPSAQAESYIFDRLIEAALPEGERIRYGEACAQSARSRHVPGRKKVR